MLEFIFKLNLIYPISAMGICWRFIAVTVRFDPILA